jgi:hypothetical protein
VDGTGSSAAAPSPRITVMAAPDDVVTARMPTPAERQALGLAEGIPVISVRRPGRAEELFGANRAEVASRNSADRHKGSHLRPVP